MHYFLDTEFIEDGRTIDLISIGVVAEDGREYYALDYNSPWERANVWVQDNVLNQLPEKPLPQMYPTSKAFQFSVAYQQGWRTKGLIAEEIVKFANPKTYGKPKFWGYYADYDWVVFFDILTELKRR